MILRTANRAAVFACLAFCSAPAHSQNHDFRFTHLTTDNGLSQSNVICILQDSKGFMWFGTFNGLNRYNGYGFEVFHDRANEAQRLSDNYISALCQDQRGDLWVGTSDGLNRYNHKSNAFQHYLHQADDPQSISDNQIETILEDRQGRLWIGTRKGGLELFDPETETFTHRVHEENDPQSLSSNFIRVLFEDSNQNLWIAHWNGALDLSDESRNGFRQLSVQGKKLTDSPITAIVESPGNILWIATQGDGLYRLEHENGEVLARAHYSSSAAAQNQLSSNTILSLLLDSQNRLWIGSEDAGIDILDLFTGTWQHCRHDPFNRSSLNHNSIWSIYEDRTENIWVGTYAYGVNFLAYRKPHFQHYAHHPGNVSGLSHNMVNAILADKNDNLWIATDGGGINLFEQQSREFFHFNRRNSNLGTDVIVSLFEDSHGRGIMMRFRKTTIRNHGEELLMRPRLVLLVCDNALQAFNHRRRQGIDIQRERQNDKIRLFHGSQHAFHFLRRAQNRVQVNGLGVDRLHAQPFKQVSAERMRSTLPSFRAAHQQYSAPDRRHPAANFVCLRQRHRCGGPAIRDAAHPRLRRRQNFLVGVGGEHHSA